jgi:hypothetical protein
VRGDLLACLLGVLLAMLLSLAATHPDIGPCGCWEDTDRCWPGTRC